jgi:hypothetical protein
VTAAFASPPARPVLGATLIRALNASHLALTVLPGPVGELAFRELQAWAEWGHRLDMTGRGMALVADIERRHRELVAERTFG